MQQMHLEQVVRNIDGRLERVEQILPTLPTREELDRKLDEKIAPLATRDELDRKLDEKIAPLATRDELDRKLDEKTAPLATREELDRKLDDQAVKLVTRSEFEARIATLATKEDLRQESERTRRHTQVLFESLTDDIRIVAEGVAATQAEIRLIVRPTLDSHERRITTLEDAHGSDRRGPAA